MSRGLKPRDFAARAIAGTEVPAYQRRRHPVQTATAGRGNTDEGTMGETEREMLREKEESSFGERKPYDSSRQATYEDTVDPRRREREWDEEE